MRIRVAVEVLRALMALTPASATEARMPTQRDRVELTAPSHEIVEGTN